MDILSPEDRVVLWRATVEAAGDRRGALLRAVAKEIYDSLGELGLYADEYAQLAVESLVSLDAAGLFATDGFRHVLEVLHEPEGGADLAGAELSDLLRAAAGDETLAVDRRLRAVEMAAQWREHILTRVCPEPAYLTVGDVAARFGVTTQAVYKWLAKGRIDATRGPGGSWRIPAAQFESHARPATPRETLDKLQRQLIALHGETALPTEDELTSGMRADD
jgi:excisionase family DNA binding protein